MRFVNKKYLAVVITILVVIEIGCVHLMYQSSRNKETKLDDVKLVEENNVPEMFAIMLEQEDGTYTESDSSNWPTDMVFNSEMSGCIDTNGNKLDGVLSFDSSSNTATVDTNSTSYCYLYFSLPVTAPDTILEGKANLTTELLGGMYRYQGTQEIVTNNYICFGTNDLATCTENPGLYMYRIIGITQDNQLKLIKKEALDTAYAWNEDYITDVVWPNGDLFKKINGTYTNSEGTLEPAFIGNSTYSYMSEGNSWYNKIETHTWKYGDLGEKENAEYEEAINANPYAAYYKVENDWTTTVDSKVNLMYLHDYLYHVIYDDFMNSTYDWTSGWLFLHNNDTSYPSEYEWLSTRYGYYGGYYFVWYVASGGPIFAFYSWTSSAYSVRPVFYLTSIDSFYGGDGTIDSPYLLKI